MNYEYFRNDEDIRNYIRERVLDDMASALERMENEDAAHYTIADLKVMKAKIRDITRFYYGEDSGCIL